jgi:hypothetical protein
MNSLIKDIKRYESDILDLEISPFETTHTLHLRSKLEEQFLNMTLEEQIELLSIDLQVIKNAKKISKHLAAIYDSGDSHRPISEWWWHLDKIANGDISVRGFNFCTNK